MKSRCIAASLIVASMLALGLPFAIRTHTSWAIQEGVDCNALNQDGLALYHNGRYPEALQESEAALNCEK